MTITQIHQRIITTGENNEIAYVIIDNHQKLNVLNTPAMESLRDTVQELSQNENLRVIVLSGQGNKAFIGGADIRELASLDATTAEPFITRLHEACEALRQAPVPVIARITGYCLGGGLEVAAACDIRISADNGVFGMPEVKVGIPSVIEAALLPRLIGWGKTCQLLYSGESIDAAQALSWGFVEQVVALNEIDDAVDTLVNSICSAAPKAIRAQKALMKQWETLPLEQAIQQGIVALRQTYETSDEPQQLMKSFLERKKN